MSFGARVLLDSVSPAGVRLTTMEWTYPRFIHAEVMTYRMFSRNTSSSRAIPVRTMIRRVLADPAGPVAWGRNQRGMQARSELAGWRRWLARQLWLKARYVAVGVALLLVWLGLHKQVANRLLEPWMWITAIITANPAAFENCWRQRCHPDAQPEFQEIATLARAAYEASVPEVRDLHAPLIQDDEADLLNIPFMAAAISTARCARVSYLTHAGRRDLAEDRRLYDDLKHADPPHTSPFEHVARASADPTRRSGNFVGWLQHREEVDPYWSGREEAAPWLTI
jgi:hypothetical protein